MNTAQKWFDVDAELQKIRETPPKIAKAPKEGENFSDFSHFSRGEVEKGQEHRPSLLPSRSPAVWKETKRRPFLPRPLGQEDAIDPFVAWEGLFHWLAEHYPEHFHAVCNAEDTLTRMEQEDITSGEAYEQACRDLLVKFEAARRLKLSQGFKIWIQ